MGDNSFKALPQLCCRCKNKDIGGRLKMPDQGQFRPNLKYRKAPVWVCNHCLNNPIRENRQGQESPLERQVREALQIFGEPFVAERKIGKFIYDFAFQRLKLLIEVDSYTYHRSNKKKMIDATKHRNAVQHGWRLVRVRGKSKLGKRAVQVIRARRMELIRDLEPNAEIAKMIYEERYGNGGN